MVRDDPVLLDKLLHDMESASEVWKPTNYWEAEEKALMPTIRREGIGHFRGSSNSAFLTFGVTSIPPMLCDDYLTISKKAAFKMLGTLGAIKHFIEEHRRTLAAFQNTCFQLVLLSDPDKEILKISDSGLANPRICSHLRVIRKGITPSPFFATSGNIFG